RRPTFYLPRQRAIKSVLGLYLITVIRSPWFLDRDQWTRDGSRVGSGWSLAGSLAVAACSTLSRADICAVPVLAGPAGGAAGVLTSCPKNSAGPHRHVTDLSCPLRMTFEFGDLGCSTDIFEENSMPLPLQPQTAGAITLVLLTSFGAPARAQVSALPPAVQQVLATVGPKWGTDIRGNIETTAEAFRPLLRAAPKDGVIVTKNQAYGEDAKQVLDVYQPIWRAGAPVVIFIHGGAYVRGDKDFYGEMYGNIATWFARHGVLRLNATYRLAPAAKWPSGADDVRGMVKWARENAAKFG